MEREREESHIKKHNHTGSTGLDTIANPLPNSRTMSSIFSRNSEANASELLENIEEIFPLCVSVVMFKHIIVCLLVAKCIKSFIVN